MLYLRDIAEKYSKSFEKKGYSIDIQDLLKEAFIEGAKFERNSYIEKIFGTKCAKILKKLFNPCNHKDNEYHNIKYTNKVYDYTVTFRQCKKCGHIHHIHVTDNRKVL